MTKFQILMPMGGLGSRFTKRGYTTPKPMIEVDGIPMFMKALSSFSPLPEQCNIFVIRQEHLDQYSLDQKILEILPQAKITVLNENTRGAAETCLLAKHDIDDKLPLIIADCDIYFESTEYFSQIKNQDNDGVLLTFKSNNPRYSYVEIDNNGKATRTAEKIVISDRAILGGYFFKSGELFKEVAKEFISDELPDNLSEYYVSHLFNMLIDRSLQVKTATADKLDIFGTPEELSAYKDKTRVP